MEDSVLGLKKKFGLLLNHLLKSGLTYEFIEERIIKDPFFLFLENNSVEVFLKTPFEKIINYVFHKEVYIDYSTPLISEYVWAGEMYITIMANERIPLQRLFLLIPIGEMLSLFEPYHEMNNYYLVQKYLQDYDKRSIVKKLLNEKDLSVRELSTLTNVNIKTLLSYMTNEKLFKASVNNAYQLSKFFDVPICLFNQQTAFKPFSPSLLKDPQMLSLFVLSLVDYLNVNINDLIINQSYDDVDKIKPQQRKYLFNVPSMAILSSGSRKKVINFLSDKEIAYLGDIALSEMKKMLTSGTLLF